MTDQITALNSHIDAQEQVIKKLEERERSLQSTLVRFCFVTDLKHSISKKLGANFRHLSLDVLNVSLQMCTELSMFVSPFSCQLIKSWCYVSKLWIFIRERLRISFKVFLTLHIFGDRANRRKIYA